MITSTYISPAATKPLLQISNSFVKRINLLQHNCRSCNEKLLIRSYPYCQRSRFILLPTIIWVSDILYLVENINLTVIVITQ